MIFEIPNLLFVIQKCDLTVSIGDARVGEKGNVPSPKLERCIGKVTNLSADTGKCIGVPHPKSK